MKIVLILFSFLLLAACAANPHIDHYREFGNLHPELLDIQKNECLALGFKSGTAALAECRKDLAQDWKNNVEANRRDHRIRPSFGIHYGIGSRW